jgi:DNA polymerase sigma
MDKRQELCSRVEKCLKESFFQSFMHDVNNVNVLPFGSFAAGLTSPSGDLDLTVEGFLTLSNDVLESTYKG